MGQLQFGGADPCGESPSLLCRWVLESTGNSTLAEVVDWVVARPAKVVLVFVVALLLNRVLRRAIRRLVSRITADQDAKGVAGSAVRNGRERPHPGRVEVERAKRRAESLGAVLRSAASATVYSLAAIIALGELGISLGPLVAGAGIVGVALGFGAQSLVRDFLSGMFMLVEDQYGVGDVVDLGEASGVVEAVNLRTTRLRDVHGTVWHVPNGEVRRVGNKSQQWARAVIDVGVSYGTDLDRAAGVLKTVVDSVWQDELENATVIEEPEFWGVESFGDTAITLRAVLKVLPGQQWAAAREVRRRLKPAFEAAGIEFPHLTRPLWSAPAATTISPPPRLESRGDPAEAGGPPPAEDT